MRLLSEENWGHLPPGRGDQDTWPLMAGDQRDSWGVTGHRPLVSPSAIITPYMTTTTVKKKYIFDHKLINIVITSQSCLSLPLESIIAGKKILCEFVTEIRHTVIVTKSVISQASVIRGTRPRRKHYTVTPNFVPNINFVPIFLSFQYYRVSQKKGGLAFKCS